MAVSQEMVIKVMADVKQALAGLKQLQTVMTGTSKAAKLAATPLMSKQLKDIDKLYSAWGDSAGATKEKLSLLKGEMRKMSAEGDTSSKRFGIYGNMIKNLSGNAGNAAFSFKNMGASLAKAGESLANNVPYMGQALQLLKQFPPQIALIIAAVVALGLILKQGVGFNAMLENEQMAFQVMLKDLGKAQYLMSELKNVALTTPIGLAEGAAGAKQLLAYGFAQEEIIDNLKMMSTVAKAVNVPLSDMVYVYGTLRAQGRAYTRDLTQFAMRGIPIYEALAATMGVPVSQLKKMGEEGKITYTEVSAAMKYMTSEGGQFAGMLEAQMTTMTGLGTVIKNTWEMLTGEMTSGIMPVIKYFMGELVTLLRSFGGLASMINVILTTIAYAFKYMYMIGIKPSIEAWRVISSIIGVIASAIKLLVRLVYTLISPVESVVGGFFKWLDPISRVVKEAQKLSALLDSIAAKQGKPDYRYKGRIPNTQAVSAALAPSSSGYNKYIKIFRQLEEGGFKNIEGLREFARMAQISFAKAVDVASNFSHMTEKNRNDLIRMGEAAGPAVTNFVEAFREEYPDISGTIKDLSFALGTDLGSDTGRVMALNTISAFKETYDRNKKWLQDKLNVGELSASAYADQMKKLDEDTKKALEPIIEFLSGSDFFAGSGNKGAETFLLEWLKLWDQFNAGKKSAKDTESTMADIFAEYRNFRKDNMTDEGIFSESTHKHLQTYMDTFADLVGQTDIYQRQITEIEKKYTDLAYGATHNKEGVKLFDLSDEERQLLIAMQDREIEVALVSRGNFLMDTATRMGTQIASAAATGFQKSYDNLAKNSGFTGQINKYAHTIKYALSSTVDDFVWGVKQFSQVKDSFSLFRFSVDLLGTTLRDEFMGQIKRIGSIIYAAIEMGGQAFTKMFGETEVGKIVQGVSNITTAKDDTAKGIAAADLWSLLLQIAMSALSELESFQEVFNGITDMLVDAFSALDPVFESLALVLPYIGRILNAVLVPIVETLLPMLQDFLLPIIALLDLLRPYLAAAVKLFAIWVQYLNPASAGLRMLWYIFKAIAKIFGLAWETYDDMANSTDTAKKNLERQLKTLQELYNVGAISGAEYEQRLRELQGTSSSEDIFAGTIFEGVFDEITAMLEEITTAIVDILVPILEILKPFLLEIWGLFKNQIINVLTIISGALQMISGLLNGDSQKFFAGLWKVFGGILNLLWAPLAAGINIMLTGIDLLLQGISKLVYWASFKTTDPGWGLGYRVPTAWSFDKGTGNVTEDMAANIHKGEIIVPGSFSDALRNGDLALSGGGMGSGGNTVVVNVEGSVVTEREMINLIADGISQADKRGYRK